MDAIEIQKKVTNALLFGSAFLGRIVVLASLTAIAWGLDYLVTGIVLQDWVIDRWFVFVGIIVSVFIGFWEFDRHDSRAKCQLLSLGEAYDENDHGSCQRSDRVVGAVELENRLLGPYLVSSNANGILLSTDDSTLIFFRWTNTLSPILVRTKDKGDGLKFSVEKNGFRNDVSIVVPWDRRWPIRAFDRPAK